jgi:hypothetical protein
MEMEAHQARADETWGYMGSKKGAGIRVDRETGKQSGAFAFMPAP